MSDSVPPAPSADPRQIAQHYLDLWEENICRQARKLPPEAAPKPKAKGP